MTRAQKVAKACGYCGASLEDKRRDARWCSENCRKRAWDASPDNRVSCEDCGELQGIGCTGKPSQINKRCLACEQASRRVQADKTGKQIEGWWNAGLSIHDIGAKLGWSKEHVGVEMFRLRERGFDLPYRHQGDRKGTGVPELRRAA